MTPKSQIKITNDADVCLIEIEGIIGVPEEWQFEQPSSRVATYEKFRDTVQQIAGIDKPEVIVDIRSTGGDVNDALLIYDALKALDARIVTRCYGYTASAATIIAQAASDGCRMLSANALYLIHNSMCAVEGNADDLEAKVDLLRKTDLRLAELYAARSGRTPQEFAALMAENGGEGRWLAPAQVVEAGLADVIIGEQTAQSPDDDAPHDFISRNWARIKALFSRRSDLPPAAVEDRNILHFGLPENRLAEQALPIAFVENQQAAKPTQTLPAEDPSVGDIRRTANELAYANDARQFAR